MKNLRLIAKTTLGVFFALVLFGTQNRTLAADVELMDGTPVRLRIMQTISSADAKAGQLVSFEVLEDVRVGNTIVIKQGTLVVATVTEARSKKTFGRKGRLSVRFDYVKAVDGTQISLRSIEGKILKINQQVENTEKREGIVSTLVKTAAFAGGVNAAPIVIASSVLKKGKDIGIAQGHLIETYAEGLSIIKVKNQISSIRSIPKRKVQSNRRPVRRNR